MAQMRHRIRRTGAGWSVSGPFAVDGRKHKTRAAAEKRAWFLDQMLFHPVDARVASASIPLRGGRRNPADPASVRVKIYTRADDGIRWNHETDSTLAEFFAANEMSAKDAEKFQRELFIRRQVVGGGGAAVEWKVAL